MARLVAIKTHYVVDEVIPGRQLSYIHNTAGEGIFFYSGDGRHEGRLYGSTSGDESGDKTYWDYCNARVYRVKYSDKGADLFIPLSWYDKWLYGIQLNSSDDEIVTLPSGQELTLDTAKMIFMNYDPRVPNVFDYGCEVTTVKAEDLIGESLTSSETINCSVYKENNMNLNISNSLLKNLRCGKAGAGFGISLFDGSISYKGHSYNGSTLVETAGFEIEAGDFLFIMPSTEIKKGDIVALTNDVAFYDGANFISLTTGAKTEYVPISCFGMTFYSVVRNMLGNLAGNGNGNAMNNLLPLMLLDKSGDSDDLMKMMLLMNGGLNFNFGAANNNSAKTE